MSFVQLPKFHSPIRLAVLLSGSGFTLKNLLECIERNDLAATVPVVIASKECIGAKRARDAGIETHVHDGKLTDDFLDLICDKHDIDLIVLAGYLKLVPITDRVRNRVVNIHPALLPSFGGRGMHGQHVHKAVHEAYQRGDVTESGCTVHFADEQYDTGSTIFQLRYPIKSTDSAQDIGDGVFELECQAYPQAIKMLIERNAQANSNE